MANVIYHGKTMFLKFIMDCAFWNILDREFNKKVNRVSFPMRLIEVVSFKQRYEKKKLNCDFGSGTVALLKHIKTNIEIIKHSLDEMYGELYINYLNKKHLKIGVMDVDNARPGTDFLVMKDLITNKKIRFGAPHEICKSLKVKDYVLYEECILVSVLIPTDDPEEQPGSINGSIVEIIPDDDVKFILTYYK